MLPNPEKGKEPLVLYTEECWACGGCVEDCPNGALTLVAPTKQRISAIWVRKDSGEEFRVGMDKTPTPNTRPPLGR
jgi:ferredoxin